MSNDKPNPDQDLERRVQNWDNTFEGLGSEKYLFFDQYAADSGNFKALVLGSGTLLTEQLGALGEVSRLKGNI